MTAVTPDLRPPSVHRVPRARVVDRLTALRAIVRGRRVVDLGFVDEGQMGAKRGRGTWLHEAVAREAKEAVGIDADESGVRRAVELGFTAHHADVEDEESLRALGLEPADVVVAGELIEHLDRPGAFLDAVHVLLRADGDLVITTPNAHALTNLLGALAGRELVNPDHVSWFSWRTLETLLSRHRWRIESLMYYRFPHVESGAPAARAAFNGYQAIARPLFALRPSLADGILVVARRA
ncbi:MAG TPA: class I SAM-dependent methyltransferase [Gaiellaceae bacterium]|nr:class I SAM-dependent methyltransferase [Gaiellaceae bacterium]